MKKLLLAFDGTHFSEGAFEFVRRLNDRAPVLVTGVFLPQVDYANLWSYAGGGMAGPVFIPLVEGEDVSVVEENIARFEALCEKNGIEFRVHKEFSDFALPSLKKETRYADALIIGSEIFYQNLGTEDPNEYLREVLRGVECPVIIVPEQYDFPENIVLAYDGSASSVFAIRQFAYIFPQLAKLPTLLLNVSKSEKEDVPDQSYIQELVARHFGNLSVFKLELGSQKDFSKWLADRKGALLVSGSYGGSSMSRMFHKSFITEVIRDHKLPVFNAHC